MKKSAFSDAGSMSGSFPEQDGSTVFAAGNHLFGSGRWSTGSHVSNSCGMRIYSILSGSVTLRRRDIFARGERR